MALTHNSTLAKSEPTWGSVDKTKLPRNAHARMGNPDEKSSWGYPHHHVQGGKTGGQHGVYVSGTMYLHRGGLRAALAAAGGARSGKKAKSGVSAHLARHSSASGTNKKETALLLGISLRELNTILEETGGEEEMADLEQLEARIRELEALLAKKDEDATSELTAQLAELQKLVDEQAVRINEMTTELDASGLRIKELEKDTHFVETGKQAIKMLKADIARVQAQCDGEDFNKELLDTQLSALGDDYDSLEMFRAGVEKRRAKMLKTGDIDQDKDSSAQSTEQKQYALGQAIGRSRKVIPIK